MELLATAFLYAWLFCVGACVGSFLNVVVYRLPHGMSLVHPGSFCPRCGHSIRLRDNIPILSWLLLGGRCRDCRTPIASRYFWVELGIAFMFLGVALVETLLTGDFPRRNWDASRWLISPYETLPFWSTYALHVVLLATLVAAALIDFDKFRTPQQIFLPVAVAALFLPAVWRMLTDHHGSFWLSRSTGRFDFSTALAGWVAGLAVGALVGSMWSWSSRRGWPKFAPVGLFVAAGAVLGWRHLLEVGAASTLLLAAAIIALRITRSAAVIPLAACVLVSALPRLLNLDIRLSRPIEWPDDYEAIIAGCCAVIATIASIAVGRLASSQYIAVRAAEETPSTECSVLGTVSDAAGSPASPPPAIVSPDTPPPTSEPFP
jgi:prepilin signal peptidase PulO-like enzyme (type II secretory pathway)